jgi:hypothetical protein
VEHEDSGLLVNNDADSWHDAMQRLIEDAPLRTRIQLRARRYVEENYSQEEFEALFLEQLQEVVGLPVEELRAGKNTSAVPAGQPNRVSYLGRLGAQAQHALGTALRLSPRQAWTALRWYIHDRRQAAWLRWQLCRPVE